MTTKLAQLTGDTFQTRVAIQAGGWKWNAEAKCFEKTVPADELEFQTVRGVRTLAGVRNRPKTLVVKFVSE